MNMRHLITTSLLCAFSLLLSDAQNNLLAQEKPLKINGSGVILGDVLFAPNASAPHIATGRGTAGLGRYHGIGVVQVNDPATGEFSSAVPFEFMKNGNGDRGDGETKRLFRGHQHQGTEVGQFGATPVIGDGEGPAAGWNPAGGISGVAQGWVGASSRKRIWVRV